MVAQQQHASSDATDEIGPDLTAIVVTNQAALRLAAFPLLSPHADRHVGDISVTVFLFVCPQDFGNGYLGRGLTYSGESLQDGTHRSPSGHLPFW